MARARGWGCTRSAWLIVALSVGACGDDDAGGECAAGSVLDGGECVPDAGSRPAGSGGAGRGGSGAPGRGGSGAPVRGGSGGRGGSSGGGPDDPVCTAGMIERDGGCVDVDGGMSEPPLECSTNEECPAGATCESSVCRPPASCDNATCLVDCSAGGSALCEALGDMVCASGVFEHPVCLPFSSIYPGDGRCAPHGGGCEGQLFYGNPDIGLECFGESQVGPCLIACGEANDESDADGDARCAALSPALTCTRDGYCTRACAADGACREGSSCNDPGSIDAHENACRPTGSFTGSPCRAEGTCSGSLLCEAGTCVSRCSFGPDVAGADAACGRSNPRLTCSESAGLCVFACGPGGECPSTHWCSADNACLPRGLPGTPCRPDGGDADTQGDCEQDLKGEPSADMTCVSGVCVLPCSVGIAYENDALCTRVSPLLTCSETAGNVCVLQCKNGCPEKHTCWGQGDERYENACLPKGSFPGGRCRSDGPDGDTLGDCDQDLRGNTDADMVCVDGVCVVECSTGGTLAEEDAVCQSVSDRLTCSESRGELCLPTCDGECSYGESCLAPGADSENVCLPNGTFLGSACRISDLSTVVACDPNLVSGSSAASICYNGRCLVDVSCSTGATLAEEDAVCERVSPLLTCSESGGDRCVLKCDSGYCPEGACLAPGAENACLAYGTFPGSACGYGSSGCVAVGPFAMLCTGANQCAVDCSLGATPAERDEICAISGASFKLDLTCLEGEQDDVCVPACDAADGSCPPGYSCLDPGGANACLRDGSFPGSACRDDSCNWLVPPIGAPVSMACVDDKCTPSCPADATCTFGCGLGGDAAGDDALCASIDPALTCSESAADICVAACGAGGACPSGYSCLGSGAENACVPTGFPGIPCRPDGADPGTAGDCDQDVHGDPDADMQCTDGVCVLPCSTGDMVANDAFCTQASPLLTCSETAGDVCALECGHDGVCPRGYTCVDPGDNPSNDENACLPTGSFLGSPCRIDGPDAGTEQDCDQDLNGNAQADMVCRGGVCVVECSTGGTLAEEDALCASVSEHLTCSETRGDLCLPSCGHCRFDESCFAPGPGLENVCLPNGTFLGSTCRADGPDAGTNGECGPDPIDDLDLVCVNNQCVVDVSCSSGGTLAEEDAICESVSPLLTCSESDGDRCVLKCDSGYCPLASCLGPGAENACLPLATFPGVSCPGTGECGAIGPYSMKCTGSSVCAVDCSRGATAVERNEICALAGASFGMDLTCFDGEDGDICVTACAADGSCPTGYACLDPDGANACLEIGSFPGSPCAEPDDSCRWFASPIGYSQPMVCSGGKCTLSCPDGDDTCVTGCGLGGDAAADDALCASIDPAWTCSESVNDVCVPSCGAGGACPLGSWCHGPGSENACLPLGLPGLPCRPDGDDPDLLGDCDRDLRGDPDADMTCVDDLCVLPCGTGSFEEPDRRCKEASPLLTCLGGEGGVCARGCGPDGSCPRGYECSSSDPNNDRNYAACVRTGSVPGRACRPDGSDAGTAGDCDHDLNGNPDADMVCIAGVCVVECSTGGTLAEEDAVCQSVGTQLTCSETGGDLCVESCGIYGWCVGGVTSCLASGAEDACLPNGTFPGSQCRYDDLTGTGSCDPHAPGSPDVEMACVGGLCQVDVSCSTGDTLAEEDTFCESISDMLTCSETAGDRCVLKCDEGRCDSGTCLAPGAENACLPNGTFPDSRCRADGCDAIGGFAMICSADQCKFDCSHAETSAAKDQLCATIGSQLQLNLTCYEGPDDICVPASFAPAR